MKADQSYLNIRESTETPITLTNTVAMAAAITEAAAAVEAARMTAEALCPRVGAASKAYDEAHDRWSDSPDPWARRNVYKLKTVYDNLWHKALAADALLTAAEAELTAENARKAAAAELLLAAAAADLTTENARRAAAAELLITAAAADLTAENAREAAAKAALEAENTKLILAKLEDQDQAALRRLEDWQRQIQKAHAL